MEILFVSNCPSHPGAVELVRNVLESEGVPADIHEVLIEDQKMASELGFIGSPTIRVNGRDVAGDAQPGNDFALSCRLYPGSQHIGLPPEEMVRRAVLEAQQGEDR